MQDDPWTQILARISQGDSDALKVIMDRWTPRLLRRAFHITYDQYVAEEIVQDTFLKLCRHAHHLNAGHLTAWLYQVTSNGSRDYLRLRVCQERRESKPLETLIDEPRPSEIDEFLDRMEWEQQVQRLPELATLLSPKNRNCLDLYRQGRTYKQIADQLQIPLGTVKSCIWQVKHPLSRRVQKVG